MRRLAATLRRDVALQVRYGLYAVSVFIVAVWGVLLHFLPRTVRLDAALLVPAFLAVNLLVTTFYFMGGLVLLEKDEGMLAAVVTTPLRDVEYLLSKVLTLAALALVESLLVAVLLFGPPAGSGFRWGLLLAGAGLLAALYALAGFVASVRHDSVNEWLLPSVAVVTFLLLPLLPHLGLPGRLLSYLHPVEPALALMRAAWARQPAGGWEIAYGLLGALAWTAAALAWARRWFDRFVVRTAGG